MAAVEYIEPKTNGTFALTVATNAGVAITTATVTATIYQPNGAVAASNVSCAHQGAGVYNLNIQPSWSTEAATNTAIEGLFVAEVKAVYSENQRVRRLPYRVQFRAP